MPQITGTFTLIPEDGRITLVINTGEEREGQQLKLYKTLMRKEILPFLDILCKPDLKLSSLAAKPRSEKEKCAIESVEAFQIRMKRKEKAGEDALAMLLL